jgi:hypothetical protein
MIRCAWTVVVYESLHSFLDDGRNPDRVYFMAGSQVCYSCAQRAVGELRDGCSLNSTTTQDLPKVVLHDPCSHNNVA